METTSAETSIKVIVFSGKSSDWIAWEEKFLARAKRRGYKELLLGKKEIPKEGEVFTKEDEVEKLKLKDLNELGYSDLMLSTDTTTSHGKVAFGLIRASKSKDYPDGNITIAWKRLKEKYAPSTAPTLAKYQKQFFGAKLRKGADPDQFITYLEDLRLKMEEMNSPLTDVQFLFHVLNNLTSDYETQITMLERRVDAKSDPLTIEELRQELCLRYERLNVRKREEVLRRD
jgi:gag-polypeptide of LTR copia-type